MHTGPTNVSHLTNSTGAVIQRYEFGAFGNITYQSGSTANNYRFQTKELHAKSNLVYFGARWYNPAIGRWITPDQAGIIDGPNLYIYLNNNPVNDIDEWGLCGGFWGALGETIGNALDFISDALIIIDIANVPSGEGIIPAFIIKGMIKGAKVAERHKGFIKGLSAMKDSSLVKTIKSLERGVQEHLGKINNFSLSRDVSHWKKEIRTFQEQLNLAIKEKIKRGL